VLVEVLVDVDVLVDVEVLVEVDVVVVVFVNSAVPAKSQSGIYVVVVVVVAGISCTAIA
jgi:hypothetical protein